MSSVPVKLTPVEFVVSMVAGGLRTERAQRKGQVRQYDPALGKTMSFQQDITAAGAELAAGRIVGAYPWGLMKEKVPDLVDTSGEAWEVRHSATGDGHLIVRSRDLKEDEDDVKYVFVTGAYYDYVVHGWAYRSEVVDDKYRRTFDGEPPCWWMPISELHPVAGA